MEEITHDQWVEMSKSVTPITALNQLNMDDIDIADCEGGACPVR
jgi:hypothetical protein